MMLGMTAQEHCSLFCAWKGGGPCTADDCPRKSNPATASAGGIGTPTQPQTVIEPTPDVTASGARGRGFIELTADEAPDRADYVEGALGDEGYVSEIEYRKMLKAAGERLPTNAEQRAYWSGFLKQVEARR